MRLMPGACKKPGLWLTPEMGGRVECPTALQGRAPLFDKFPKVGCQGIHQATPKSIMP